MGIPARRSGEPRRVVIVGFDDCQALDLIGPLDVFAGASELQARAGARDPGYVAIVASGGPRRPRRSAKAIRTSSGLAITASITLERAAAMPIDTLVLAGGTGARRAAEDPRTLALVRKAAAQARRVTSVCTGAFVLAAAGLLDGRRATTHWAFCRELAARWPRVKVEDDPIFVRDGSVWTSAGVSAGVDLSLALVEQDLGRDAATLLARWLVVFVRRAGGQSQFSAQLAAQAAERPSLRDLQAWIVEHPDAALDVPQLAHKTAMSVRHFGRMFRAEVGMSPAAYVERVRLETARRLLETTGRSIDEVAGAAGFGTPEALRRAFARRIGLSPREYRNRFGSSQGAPS